MSGSGYVGESEADRLTAIKTNITKLLEKIRSSTKLVKNETGQKLSVVLEFGDEGELVEELLKLCADCKYLYEKVSGEPL